MFSIAYVSAANVEMVDEDIAALLVQARANNIRHDLTGALIYHRGRFIQILEGPEEQVLARFAVISADPRHRSIHVVSEERTGERQFPEWTMGFRPLADDAVTALAILRITRIQSHRGEPGTRAILVDQVACYPARCTGRDGRTRSIAASE